MKSFTTPATHVLLAAMLGGLSMAAQAQSSGETPPNPSSTTTQREAQRGVPGVDLDVNRSGQDRGVPGIDASVGADRDQSNIDTRSAGAAGSATQTQTTTRTMRADRN